MIGKITVERVAKRERVTPAAIYAQIKDGRGVGKYFKHEVGFGYFIASEKWHWLNSNVNELTEYPALFGGTYWGNSTPRSYDENEIEQIINNRNKFAIEYNLKNKSVKKPHHDKRSRCFDHVEAYTVKNSKDVIIVSSPYLESIDEYMPKEGINNWFMIPSLYNNATVTFGFWHSENKHLFVRGR